MEQLYRYNPWWEGEYHTDGLKERATLLKRLVEELSSKRVVFITGLRRVGKTTLMKLLISYLIREKNVKPNHIFYVSVDDYAFSKHNLAGLVDEFRKIHRLSVKEHITVFFDEITHQPDFEQQLKNLHDLGNSKIFASSSSSSLMKSKKSYLTGRSTVLEVLPLNFEEFLQFKNVTILKRDAHLTESYFEEYLETGGIPEYVLRKDPSYLAELVDDIIYKDIAAEHNIRNLQILKDFFLLLMERSGKQVSINKVANILDISPDTAKRYLQMFASTYLVYVVPRHGKTNEKILAPKKIYAADIGIRNFFTGFRDKGSLFENYIYLQIKNKDPHYVYQDGIEIDFLTRDNILIEVKYKSKMTEKQKSLFNSFKAKKKMIISGIEDASAL